MKQTMNPTIFRESDIRGIVGSDLTEGSVDRIARSVGTYVRRRGGRSVALGWDIRPSSFEFRHIALRALLATGCDVVEVGCVPTPVCYFAQHQLHTDGGLMITASHNPAEFNGFKVGFRKECLFGPAIQELKHLAETEDFCAGRGAWRNQHNILDDYIGFIRSRVSLPREVRIAIDGGNGCYGVVGPNLFERLGIEPVHIHLEPDGSFPNHHPDPTLEENLLDLKKTVVDAGVEFGIGFDGDVDRIGVVDETGSVVWGDQLLILFARDILSRHPGAAIIGEVKCSQTLFEEIRKRGGMAIMSAAGHSLIKNKMRATGALLAGEMSGHFFFADNYPGYDDALFAACRLLQIVAEAGRSMADMLQDISRTAHTPEIRLNCPDNVKFQLVQEMMEYFRGRYEISEIDGIRVQFPKGWALVRASNTQPALTLRFEAVDVAALEEIKSQVLQPLKDFSAERGIDYPTLCPA